MKPLAERFWRKVDKRNSDDCWPWLGWRHPCGAGQLSRGRRTEGLIYAHVASWELHNGAVPQGMVVCHHCDNPWCVNPAHLFVGTMKDNTTDMVRKKRHAHGEKTYNAVLTSGDVLAIRKLKGRETQGEIAERYDVSRSLIGLIQRKERWRHLP